MSCVCTFIGALSGGAQLQQQRSFVRQSVRNAERAELHLIDNPPAVKALRHQMVVNNMEKVEISGWGGGRAVNETPNYTKRGDCIWWQDA